MAVCKARAGGTGCGGFFAVFGLSRRAEGVSCMLAALLVCP